MKLKLNDNYDITFVGAGPSTVFSVLKLIGNNYPGKILIIDKGKKIEERGSDIINGFFGAGCYSDSKLSSALTVGGYIPWLTESQLEYYSNYILDVINEFKLKTKDQTPLTWDVTTPFDTQDSSLDWDIHKTCHVGTDNGQAIYYEIEKFIENQPNITMAMETEVTNVFEATHCFQLIVNQSGETTSIFTSKLVLATGQKGTLVERVLKDNNINHIYRPLQLGIRVEDIINPQYEEIIKANYDFKFTKTYNYNNVKVKVRTFCCNSGNAHTCAEINKEGFTCFNGHAYKQPDPNNHTVNYGIMCEVSGLNNYKTKEDQIDLMKEINKLPTWKNDNFTNNRTDPKRELLDGFEFLRGVYPDVVVDSLTNFVYNLNKLVDLSKAHFLYPEVKLSGTTPEINHSFETSLKNLYIIGDASVSRGIIKASISGIMLAEHIINDLKVKEVESKNAKKR